MPPEWNQRTPPAKIAFQSKSPGLSSARGLVRAVVEDDRRPHAVRRGRCRRSPCSARGRRRGRTTCRTASRPSRARGPGSARRSGTSTIAVATPVLQAEAIGEVRGDVVLAAGDVDVERAGLAERDDARVEAVDEGAEREEVEVAGVGTDREVAHRESLGWRMTDSLGDGLEGAVFPFGVR